jgi:guanosine-3',5'-bis(diphosphate) 3'-pyrophosphohydrolase
MDAELLKSIIHFTDHAHGEQTRKYTGERYIVHPIRVMQICQQYIHDPCVLAAALMHDVLEDTPVTKEQIASFLRDKFNPVQVAKTVDLVVELTDVFTKENFPRLNRRSRKEKEVARLSNISFEGQTIKYADVMDNAVNIVQHDQEFGYVYLKECESLLNKMGYGNPVLHERARHTVAECLDRVKKLNVPRL